MTVNNYTDLNHSDFIGKTVNIQRFEISDLYSIVKVFQGQGGKEKLAQAATCPLL